MDWTPSFTDGGGRFLHDFSYAGYKMQGEDAIPTSPPRATYKVSPGSNNYCLRIDEDGVVLRGAGTGATYLYCSEPNNRQYNMGHIGQSSKGHVHAEHLDLIGKI